MTTTLEELQYADSHIISIEENPFDISSRDYDLTPYGEHATKIEGLIVETERSLGAPFIEDDFTDHEKRRVWKNQLPLEIRKTVENNALRINKINSAGLLGQLMRKAYEKSQGEVPEELASKLDKIDKIRNETRGYDKLKPDKKKELVRELRGAVSNALEYFGTN